MTNPAFDLAALRRLSIPERLQLLGDLWDSIAEEAPDEALPLTPELAAELERRLAEHDANPGSAIPWDEVKEGILRKLRPNWQPHVIARGSEDPPQLALRLLPRAAAEIEAVFAWYELQSGGLGTEFLRALEATFAKLLRHPGAAAEVRPRIRRALLRRFPYGVFYTQDHSEVIVLAVVHARRNPSSWPGPPEV